MKRLVRDGRVLYIRRHFGWSILFFGLSLAIVAVAWLNPSPEKKELGAALYYGVPLAWAAMVATLRSEVFAIDRNQGKLLHLYRQVFRARRVVHDLSTVAVVLKSVRRQHWVWIEVAPGRSTLFRSAGGEAPREDAERLAGDLGCPLRVEGD